MAKPSSQSNTDSRDDVRRDVLPIPDPQHVGLTTYDAKDPNTSYPPIKDAAATRGRAQRADRADRRCRLRCIVGVRRPVRHPGGRAAGRRRVEAQPLSHHGAVLAHPAGAADRTQPSLGRHGRDHRDGDLGTGQQQHPAQEQGADRRDAEAQRLLDRPVRQVPRGAGVGGLAGRAVPPVADRAPGSSTSTASSAARPTSTTPGSTRAPRRSSRRAPPRRATRSPRTWPTAPSPGCASRRRSPRTSRSSCTSRPAPPTPRTTCRQGVVGQVPGQVRRGLGCAAGEDHRPAEEAWGDPGRRRADPASRRDPGLGRHAGRISSRCWPGRWRSTPASWSRPITRSAG